MKLKLGSRLKIIVLLGIFFFPGIVIINGQETLQNPIVETWDLLQTGTLANPYKLNITKDFDVVTKMNWILDFDDNSLDWNNFAADTPLTNGLYINYTNGNMIGSNITNNHDLMTLAYNAHYYEDDKNPIGNIIWVQHLLTSFIDGGVVIDSANTLEVWIQDDLTDAGKAIESFTVTLKGFDIYGSIDYETQTLVVDKRTLFGVISPDLMFFITLLSLFAFFAVLVYYMLLKD